MYIVTQKLHRLFLILEQIKLGLFGMLAKMEGKYQVMKLINFQNQMIIQPYSALTVAKSSESII